MSDGSEEIRDRENAKLVLDNPAYKKAMEILHKKVMSGIKTCPQTDKELAIRLVIAVQVVDGFEAALNAIIEDGDVKEAQWKEIEAQKKPLLRIRR